MNTIKLLIFVTLSMLLLSCAGGSGNRRLDTTASQSSSANPPSEILTLEKLQQDTFRYFWETTKKTNGLAPDRYPSNSPSSITAVSFALTSYAIGVERQYITRSEAVKQTLTTLRFFRNLPQGPAEKGTAGTQGFFYRFLDMNTGLRHQNWEVEISTVDTALLMAGILFVQSYFDQDNEQEAEIRLLADQLYRSVNWQWAQHNYPLMSLGWMPETGFLPYDWAGYSEAMILYILALGSPTFPVEPEAWQGWTKGYHENTGGLNEFRHLTFASLFGHQYSHVFIDFRNIQDPYMIAKKSDYFQNSRIATYSQRQYAIANPNKWNAYGKNIWGLTACDGPGKFTRIFKGSDREFRGYTARGVALNLTFDDGTIAPTAAGGSLPFAPEIVIPALQAFYDNYGEHLYGNYGFRDAINPSFTFDVTSTTGKIIPGIGWVANDYIGIDQGPILAMAENFRSELIWKTMKKNPYIKRGLERAGFSGGWLNQ